jgi:hypothetical protein
MPGQRLKPLQELRRLEEDEARRALGAAIAARERAEAASEAWGAKVEAAHQRLARVEGAQNRAPGEATSGRALAERARFRERLRLEQLEAERTWREFRATELARAVARERAAAEAYRRSRAERQSLDRHVATEEQAARRLNQRRSEET